MIIKPIIDTSKPVSDNKYTIKIYLYHNGKKKVVKTDYRIEAKFWKDGAVHKSYPNYEYLNGQLKSKCLEYEAKYLKNQNASLDEIITGNTSNEDFYTHFQKHLDFIKKKHSIDYYTMFNSIFKKLQEFKPTMRVSELTFDFLRSYEMHLIGKGNHPNTIHNNFKRISQVVKEMVKGKHLGYADNPFLEFKVNKVKTKKDRLVYEDIIKLAKQSGIAVDMYMLSFYCGGIRIGDELRLEHTFIKDGRLKYTMHKTNITRDIKLPKQALEIIKRYPRNKKNPYIFGLLVPGLNEEQESIMISTQSSKYRKQLKAACKKAKVKEVSFHTSRHSFADLAKTKGEDIHTIKELLGHGKTETTEIYMKELYQETNDKALDNLFGG